MYNSAMAHAQYVIAARCEVLRFYAATIVLSKQKMDQSQRTSNHELAGSPVSHSLLQRARICIVQPSELSLLQILQESHLL